MCNLNTSWDLEALKFASQLGHLTSEFGIQGQCGDTFTQASVCIPANLHFPCE